MKFRHGGGEGYLFSSIARKFVCVCYKPNAKCRGGQVFPELEMSPFQFRGPSVHLRRLKLSNLILARYRAFHDEHRWPTH